ncbi:MAG: ATP-grasp domain-containing protein [Candidatus Heimdallarchaeota archaeon]|nr:ATP-grasp domain-containing protein [Candidatus Heimdallarchaeota archaeon]
MFSTLLVANRGEIAVRIIRAARELDIKTYAIFTSVDKNALHVKLANEAFALMEDGKIPGYLDIDQIISICVREGIESVHPGYGFLSESEVFAKKLTENGIKFIGPPAEVIELLGNKVKSRKKAIEACLQVPSGSDIIIDENDGILQANMIGYPVLVKAVFGGGGMGIQIAHNDKELKKALQSASAQAQAAFGRGEVFIEKFINQPRHIEFQILADNYGNVVHLGERECSIQRRNQKLLEESPSKAITRAKRNEIGSLVCRLAKNLGYISAGTVEFLYLDNQVLFNEINPRIQVEHPVTEMLTGKDIVKEQIKIAQGEELSFKQSEIKFRGHAMELRINAEDPLNNFQPTPGLVQKFNAPGGPQVRFDTAIYEGLTVPNCYDSLIGKLIVAAETRGEAISRAQNALKELVVIGFPNNISFFQELIDDEKFQKGDISINFIQDQKLLEKLEKNVCTLASALFAVGLKKSELNLPQHSSNWRMKSKMDAIGKE